MSEAEVMRTTEGSGDLAPSVAETLAARLARFQGTAYRKAYLADLLKSGTSFEASGNSRGAEYCFAKVADGLKGEPDPSEDADGLDRADASVSEESHDGEPVPEAGPDSGPQPGTENGTSVNEPRLRKPRSAPAKPREKNLTPIELIRRKWRTERLKDAEEVLDRHAGRLSSLENRTYREKLDKLRLSGLSAATPAQSSRADAGLLELRRRLYNRILKSQKISLTRSRMPVTLGRLALPPSRPGTKSAGPAALPAVVTGVRVDTAWQPVTGPYNDRYNMEDLLGLIAEADAAWVEEFLELYRGLSGLQNLMHSIAPKK
ncbi:MAG: hypothetical protein JWP91_486 [Fibrobacteres bacterium]|nr:hypothetical protein [Fibrobacterota bacterium]